MVKKSKELPIYVYGFGILLAAIVLLFPLWKSGFIRTDDGSWMVIRLSAFYQSFREGQFPVRFLGRLNFGYGYPVPNFLYPGFLYLGSIIHILGLSFVSSVKAIFSLSVVGSALFLFFWLRKFFRAMPSFVGSISMLFAPYLGYDMYTRGSVGEVFALLWVAVILFSIEANLVWLFILAVPALIISHNSLALLFGAFIGLYLWKRGKLSTFLIPTVLGVGLSAFFWIPALNERKYVVFDRLAISDPASYFITNKTLWIVSIAQVLAWFAVVRMQNKHPMKVLFLFAFFISLALALPVSGIVWNIPLVSKLFQFPFRMLSLSIIAGAWLVSYCLEYVGAKRLLFTALVVGLSVYSLLGVYKTVRYEHEPEGYYTTNEATTTVQDEYMPRWVGEKPTRHAVERIEFYKGRGVFDIKKLTTQSIEVTVDAKENSIVQLNTLYYPGWGVIVDDVYTYPDYHNSQGIMRVSVPAGKHRLVAMFRETISRFIADCISVISAVAAVVYSIVYRKKTI